MPSLRDVKTLNTYFAAAKDGVPRMSAVLRNLNCQEPVFRDNTAMHYGSKARKLRRAVEGRKQVVVHIIVLLLQTGRWVVVDDITGEVLHVGGNGLKY